MNKISLRGMAAIAAFAAGMGAAAAQQSSNVVATEGDWTVFEDGGSGNQGKLCWAVSPPKSVKNLDANGKPKEVTRGDIRLYVSYRPGQAGEVSFTGGYPFAPDSAVEVDIGGAKYNLFTEGENAWTGSPAEDAKLIGSLRAGSTAVLSARSSRGTRTIDTFSLSGITAATNTAQARCK